MISIGADGSIQRVNQALSKIFPPEHGRRAPPAWKTFLARRHGRNQVPDEARAPHRRRVAADWNCAPAPQDLHLAVTVSALEEKLTSGFVVVLEDTSELLRAQKTAAWHEVARRVAHEIKNPLTPIALSAERIAPAAGPPGRCRPEPRASCSECAATISQARGIGEDAGGRVLAVRALSLRPARRAAI